jgi:uncharacterized protein YqjF (DUF2071 family)
MAVMTQKWRDLAFIHWAYAPDEVRRLLPSGVEVDTFDGRAWVALVPFRMTRLRLKWLPPIPTTANFPEINVRTYVRVNGRPAVWFFSLDTPKLLPTIAARAAFRLPYCFGRAKVSVDNGVLESSVVRRWPSRATSHLRLRIGDRIEAGDLERFLTDRWGLIAPRYGGGLNYGPVDHEPWPLHSGELLEIDDQLVTAAGLSAPVGSPHVLFSPGVSVAVDWLRRA